MSTVRFTLIQISFNLAAAAAALLQSCPTHSDAMDCKPTRLLCPWDFPGKSTGVGCHFLLQYSSTENNSWHAGTGIQRTGGKRH